MVRPHIIIQHHTRIKNNVQIQQRLYLHNYFLKQNNEKINHFLMYNSKNTKQEKKQYIDIDVANRIQILEDNNRLLMIMKKQIYDEQKWYWDEDFENM